MAFVNKSGGDDQQDASDVAAGAPPPEFAVDFDPADPDVVKVHYDLTGWTIDQRAELAETLAERSVPHLWDGDELVVPEAIEAAVDALFDELEAEIGPFPVALADGAEATEFGLDEWPVADLESLRDALADAEIPHRWEGRTLLVASDAEHVVDDLLDAIESGEVAVLDDGGASAPDGALHTLYDAADRLARDPVHGASRQRTFDLVPQLSPAAPPFGLAVRSWATIVDRANGLVGAFEAGGDPEAISVAAADLRDACRPFV